MKRFGIICCLLFCSIFGRGGNITESPKNIDNDLNVSVYPNPFVDELTVRCEDADIKTIEVWSIKHKQELVFSSPIELPKGAYFTINTSNYQRGYYAIRIYFHNAATKTIMLSK